MIIGTRAMQEERNKAIPSIVSIAKSLVTLKIDVGNNMDTLSSSKTILGEKIKKNYFKCE